jgi:hypothetical protein
MPTVRVVDETGHLPAFARIGGEIAALGELPTRGWFGVFKGDPPLHGIEPTQRLIVFGGDVPAPYGRTPGPG